MSAILTNDSPAVSRVKRPYCRVIKNEILYDDNCDKDRFYAEKQYLAEHDAEQIMEEQGLGYDEAFEIAMDEIDENRVWDSLYSSYEIGYKEAKQRIDELMQGRCILALGNIGTWRGNFAGGDIYDDFKEFAGARFKDADYTKIWIEGGVLKIKVIHHDGTDIYTLKPLQDRGLEAYHGWDCGYTGYERFWGLDKEAIHKKLWDKPYYTGLLKEAVA